MSSEENNILGYCLKTEYLHYLESYLTKIYSNITGASDESEGNENYHWDD